MRLSTVNRYLHPDGLSRSSRSSVHTVQCDTRNARSEWRRRRYIAERRIAGVHNDAVDRAAQAR